MPPTNTDYGDLVDTQQFPFTATPATRNVQVIPANPSRAYLLIQNQGLNQIVAQFDKPTGNVNDYIIPGLGEKEWAIKVPVGSVNIGCSIAGGSTGVVIDGRRR